MPRTKLDLTHEFALQVSPVVKKYIQKEPGFNFCEIRYGTVLFDAMPFAFLKEETDERFKNKSTVILVRVTQQHWLKLKYYTRIENRLSSMLSEMWKQTFVVSVRLNMRRGMNLKKSILDVLDYYELTPKEYSFEAATKTWQRANGQETPATQ